MPDIFLTDKDKNVLEGKIETKANKSDIKTKFSADDINAGILSVLHGGTGADNAEDALKNLGALAVETGTYTGTHVSGDKSPKTVTLTFTKKPAVVFITTIVDNEEFNSDGSTVIIVKDALYGCSLGGAFHKLTWANNSVTFETTVDHREGNVVGLTYQYIAIL